MGPKVPEAEGPRSRVLSELEANPAATGTTTVCDFVAPEIQHRPRIPQEIIDEILDHLIVHCDLRFDAPLSKFIRSCSLISTSWVTPCRRYLFRTIVFDVKGMYRWLEAFPVPDRSPAHHLRDLSISSAGELIFPDEFLGRIQWFTNVKQMTMLGQAISNRHFDTPSFVGVPQSVTSLTIESPVIDTENTRNIMALLPNLDDLSLSGTVSVRPGTQLQGFGKVLRARFGGRLRLHKIEGAEKDFVNMLLEVPTGLRFTEVHVDSLRERLLSTVRLAEACRSTLVKLSYGGLVASRSYTFPLPNLFQHHDFRIDTST